MQTFQVLAGSTSLRLQVFLRDSSVNYDKGLTGLLHNTGSLAAHYFRDGDTIPIVISLVTVTVGTFTSSGFKAIDGTNQPGMYEIGIPNAALASGAKWVTVTIRGAANLCDEVIRIELLGNNIYSAAWSDAFNEAMAAKVAALTLETGVTWQQALRAIAAYAAGDFDESTDTFKALDNSGTTRITTSRSAGSRTNTVSL